LDKEVELKKGYFIHRAETAGQTPAQQDFIIVRATLGKDPDTLLYSNWDRVGQVLKMLYCSFPASNLDGMTVYDSASAFVEAIQNVQAKYGQVWRQGNLVLNGMSPIVDLMFIDSWVSYLYDTNHGVLKQADPKPLIYITPEKWKNITDGLDENVINRVLAQASLISSEYNVATPAVPAHTAKTLYWEYKPAFVYASENGVYDTQVTTPPVVVDPGTGSTGTASGDVNIHMLCPYCGKKIF
jgi:hypothetical protein